MNNFYFVKLLILCGKAQPPVLLYGFCSPAARKTYTWKTLDKKSKQLKVYTAVLSKVEFDDFTEALTRPGSISAGELSFSSPQLVKRPEVLSNDGNTRSQGPISEYRRLIELWNVNKKELFEKIESGFAENARNTCYAVKELFSWARSECGIDFSENGWRLGNFEIYEPSKYIDAFEVETYKECDLTKTTIKKKRSFSIPLIVNCTASHRGRSIINQSRTFAPDEETLEFISNEPMVNITVQIWEQESGKLIFSKCIAILMNLSLNVQTSSGQYFMQDLWSQKLYASAGNRSEIIREQIERLSRSSSYDTFSIKSKTYNSIDAAIEAGNCLASRNKFPEPKGAFIANHAKNGEIESFLKIIEYLKPSSVKKAVIADPYFSAYAAGKILSRIPRSDIEIEIITFSGNTDPDTGNKISKYEELQKFLTGNCGLLHNNLRVYNLHRQGSSDKQVFHDRYLIRYFDNGIIDGFLLSNSLNSMGQFYPFVIAPLEHEVCMEVCEHLNSMLDSDIQAGISRGRRIVCDVLYDSRHKETQAPISDYGYSIIAQWLAPWCNEDSEISIPVQDLDKAVEIIKTNWNNDRNRACRALSMISLITAGYSPDTLADIIKKKGIEEEFTDVFLPLAEDIETKRDYKKISCTSPVYGLRALLIGSAKPNPAGFERLFHEAGHIWYQDHRWLHGGYTLLLWLSPKVYIAELERLKSPLMFDILAARMLFWPWDEKLFLIAMEADSNCIRALCIEWIFQQLESKEVSCEDVEKNLRKVSIGNRLLPCMHLISKMTFHLRMSAVDVNIQTRNRLYSWLIKMTAADAAACTSEIRKEALAWLNDCEEVSECRLHLRMADASKDKNIRDEFLRTAISAAEKSLVKRNNEKPQPTELISLYVTAMDALYGEDSEKKILGKIVDWNVFETTAEPELKNYAHDRWYAASIRAKWQVQMLREYHRRHPEAEKTQKWLNMWEEVIQ